MTAETETRSSSTTSRAGCCAPGPRRTPRPTSCFRIDDRKAGRELMRRLSAVVASAANPTSPLADTWVSVALTYQGLQALGRAAGVARQLRLGVPAGHGRAREGAGRHRRERPRALGAPARDAGRPRRARRASRRMRARLEAALERARAGVPGALAGDRGDLAAGLPRAAHRDGAVRIPGRHQPSGHRRQRHPGDQPAGSAPQGRRVRARLSRRDWAASSGPTPEILGRNGTYVVFRKLHQRVAAFRRYLDGERDQPRGGGAPGGQDDGAMAQRRAARALPAARRPGARGGPATATTTSCTKRTIRPGTRRPAARTSGGPTRATRPSPAWRGSTA